MAFALAPHPLPFLHHPSTLPFPPSDSRTLLFVGNLPFRVRWQDLKDLFRKAGTVLRADVSLTLDNRSKGFGSVLFANRVDALKAIDIYNGFSWQSRSLDVRLDQNDPSGSLLTNPQLVQSRPHNPYLHFAPPSSHSSSTGYNSHQPSCHALIPGPRDAGLHASAPSPSDDDHQSTPSSTSKSSSNSIPPPPRTLSDSSSLARHLSHLSLLDPSSCSSTAASSAPTLHPPVPGTLLYPPPPGCLQHHHHPPHVAPPYHLPLYRSNSYHAPPPSVSISSITSDRQLFVGNLPFNFQWQDLKDLFRRAGNILCADVATGPDGRSRGFGTVLFATPEDAQQALRMYDGYNLQGRILSVCDHRVDLGATPSRHYLPHPPHHLYSYPSAQSCSYSSPVPITVITEPDCTVKHGAEQGTGSSVPPSMSSHQEAEQARLELWTADPVTLSPNPPCFSNRPPLSPIASRRPSQFKSSLSAHHYKQLQPIGHSYNNQSTKPQSIPMPPPYDLTGGLSPGVLSPSVSKIAQITPSMPAFSFQALPVTPPLLPQFFSPGIGPEDGATTLPGQAPPGMAPLVDELGGPSDGTTIGGDKDEFGNSDYCPILVIEQDDCERLSNVDWGHHQSYHHNGVASRRASFFVGAPPPGAGTLAGGMGGIGNDGVASVGGPAGGAHRDPDMDSLSLSSSSCSSSLQHHPGFSGVGSLVKGRGLRGGRGAPSGLLLGDHLLGNPRRASFDISSLLNSPRGAGPPAQQEEQQEDEGGGTGVGGSKAKMHAKKGSVQLVSNGLIGIVGNSGSIHARQGRPGSTDLNQQLDDREQSSCCSTTAAAATVGPAIQQKRELVGLGFGDSIWQGKKMLMGLAGSSPSPSSTAAAVDDDN